MCGIVGYIGKKNALPIVVNGLKKLEYRGYDSAGVALWDGSRIRLEKTIGRVAALESKILRKPWVGTSAIAHTRWATHGKPSDKNAHPHTDCSENIFLVHNGIVENYTELKEALIREGHVFRSETDTEVLVHLVERPYLHGNNILLEDALLEALRHVRGTFGLAVISNYDPEKIVVARRGSPIILGVGENEYFLASDAAAIIGYTKNAVYLHDNELAILTPQNLQIINLSKKVLKKEINKIDWDIASAEKGGHKYFMHKEIFEGPEALKNVSRGRIQEGMSGVKFGGFDVMALKLKNVKKIVFVACGTSYYAGLIGKYFFEEFAYISAETVYASEFRYSNPVLGEKGDTAVILISQSGETADTLQALREAKKKGSLVLGIINAVGSSIARESGAGIYNYAGPEIGVASTKAFISQIGALFLMSLYFAGERGKIPETEMRKLIKEFSALPAKIEQILKQDSAIRFMAEKYSKYNNFLYLGRKYQYPVALEGALKLKEVSYKHAEGFAAGEMKHGPIALIDKNFPTIALAPKGQLYDKMLANMEEIKARGGRILAIATEGDAKIARLADDVIFIPDAPEALQPFLSVIPLQLFAYHTADLLDLDVDKPRNLAKSVTVE